VTPLVPHSGWLPHVKQSCLSIERHPKLLGILPNPWALHAAKKEVKEEIIKQSFRRLIPGKKDYEYWPNFDNHSNSNVEQDTDYPSNRK
jgi:hypothetical protein